MIYTILLFFSCIHACQFSKNTIKLIDAAIEQTHKKITYNGKYFSIPYPNGDIPKNIGVCTDLIIRSYRKALGIDLQKLVHEDMKKHFNKYPNIWKLKKQIPISITEEFLTLLFFLKNSEYH